MDSSFFGIPYARGCVFPMKELKAGFLMLLVCVALYIQIDPRIWNGVCQLLTRFMIGWN
jgi:hypothetical protein